jgi:YVTN family beta-propeller protein
MMPTMSRGVLIAAASVALALGAGIPASQGLAAVSGTPGWRPVPPVTAYVATGYPDVVRPVRLATRKVLPPVRVRGQAFPLAVTPEGRTVVVVTYVGGNRTVVSLIRTATGKAYKAVKFTGFAFVWPVAITPNSKTAYVVNDAWRGTVFPIQIRTGHLGSPIHVGHDPQGMAITPDGRTLYVTNEESGTVTPIRTATNTALQPIRVGRMPGAIVITPDGKTAYVDSETTDAVTPIRVATNTALKPIKAGRPAGFPDPQSMVITPSGKTIYRLSAGGVTPITVATNRARKKIPVDSLSDELAITPDGRMVYAIDALYGVLTPIRTATNTALPKIRFGQLLAGVAFTPDSRFMYVGTKGGLLVPVRISTGKRGKAIRLRGFMNTLAIAP